MAIGLVPRFVQQIKLDSVSPQHWIILAIIAVQRQGWQLQFYSGNGLVAYMQVGNQGYQLTVSIKDGSVSVESKTANGHFVDWGKNKKNVAGFIAGVAQEQAGYNAGQLGELYEQVSINFPPAEADVILHAQNAPKEKAVNLFSIFIPRKGFWITPLLIDINALVFILMTASGADILSSNSEVLIKWGANFKPLTLNGEWWRLISSCFLHIGVLHLFMNMFALIFIGILLEAKLGRVRFLTAYLLTGITASMTSLYWHDITISAGASGAIFGMYGVFFAMLTTNLIQRSERKTQLISIAIFIVYNLVGGLKGNIDNSAHIGGLIGGMFIGYVFYPGLKNKKSLELKVGGLLIVSVAILLSSFLVFKTIPNNAEYNGLIGRYQKNETESFEVYKMQDSLSAEKLLPQIADAVEKWQHNIQIIDSASRLDLSKELQERNTKLKYYTGERLESFKLFYTISRKKADQDALPGKPYPTDERLQDDFALRQHYHNCDSILRLMNTK